MEEPRKLGSGCFRGGICSGCCCSRCICSCGCERAGRSRCEGWREGGRDRGCVAGRGGWGQRYYRQDLYGDIAVEQVPSYPAFFEFLQELLPLIRRDQKPDVSLAFDLSREPGANGQVSA